MLSNSRGTTAIMPRTRRTVQTATETTAKRKGPAKKPPQQSSSPSSSAQPTAKKHRKTKKTDEEKRLARFIKAPNQSVSERIGRAYTHRLYLIDAKPSPTRSEFAVLGATGNVYTVVLDLKPSCTCPDFARGNTCKHILFVMLRVLKLDRYDPRVWQKALLSTELQELCDILTASADSSAVFASDRVRSRFLEISAKGTGATPIATESSSVRKGLDGDCPVCYEPLQGSKEDVVFCKTCGNNVHRDCFERWSKSKKGTGGAVTCVYCRAPWETEGADKKGKGKEKYVNLAEYSDVHRGENLSLSALYPESYQWIRRHG